MRALLIVSSYHHGNTLKVAQAIADRLQAQVISPEQVKRETLSSYDLIGFGSGIYSAKHHPDLLKLAEELPDVDTGKAFLFSTDGMPRFAVHDDGYLQRKMLADHAALRQRLQVHGYTILGNFGCAGYNTNSFLKLFGGINKGRPSVEDTVKAEKFADELIK